MANKIKVTWYSDDGYIGRDRPHYVLIDPSDLAECESVGDIEDIIDGIVDEEFKQRVSWDWDRLVALQILDDVIEARKSAP